MTHLPTNTEIADFLYATHREKRMVASQITGCNDVLWEIVRGRHEIVKTAELVETDNEDVRWRVSDAGINWLYSNGYDAIARMIANEHRASPPPTPASRLWGTW